MYVVEGSSLDYVCLFGDQLKFYIGIWCHIFIILWVVVGKFRLSADSWRSSSGYLQTIGDQVQVICRLLEIKFRLSADHWRSSSGYLQTIGDQV